ncbi:MAG: AraC family transcriptional regulator N-terminal domain-containing protein [Acidobacteriota bacterium]|jgi:AraC-like DNA-binding protein
MRLQQNMRDGEASLRLNEARQGLARRIASHFPSEGALETSVPGLALYRQSTPTACSSAAYEPRLVVFVQGQKRIDAGAVSYLCDGSNFLIATVDLPVLSQVVSATRERPMLGLLLRLEMPLVRKILGEEEFSWDEDTSKDTPRVRRNYAASPNASQDAAGTHGIAVGTTTTAMLDACSRLVDLLDAPQDIGFLSGLIEREIIYRLLRSPQGKHLRAIATLGEQSQRTAKAVGWLRRNYSKPLRVEDLAEMAQMGVSTLHHHFRTLTAMSPIQYQKQLRLHVARERMMNDGLDAASAAFEVGYESASQFSREYRRFFGQSPMRDVKERRFSPAPGEQGNGIVAVGARD